MKKILLIIFCILILNLFITLLAQEGLPYPAENTTEYVGEYDEKTGLPKSFNKFKEAGEKLSEEEQRKEYLKQEWTKLLAKNKILGPILFYTHKSFSFFNPFWELVFGIRFFWSWAFFLSIFLWLVLIFVFYFPMTALLKSSLFGLLSSIVLASLIGVLKVIAKAVKILETAITDLWKLTLFFVIILIILALYSQLIKLFKKESKEEELERAKESVKAHGKVSEKALGEFSEGGGI